MDIYLKPKKKSIVRKQDWIYVKDVSDVYVSDDSEKIKRKIEEIKLIKTGKAKNIYLVSILDIIEAVEKEHKGYTFNNVGEMDTVVEFSPEKPKDKAWVKYSKILLVSIVLFVGSATAIMSFHSDAEMPTIFKQYHKMFFGEGEVKPYILNIPYSIGLAFGIIVFFNHFAGRKITNDPTPIEVQMALYENDITETMVDALSAPDSEKKKEQKEKKDN